MAHINDQPLSHRKCQSNITLIWNNGHDGAAACEYEYTYVRGCGIHTCHHNRLLVSTSLAPFLRSTDSRPGMQGQKAITGANPVHLQTGKKTFLVHHNSISSCSPFMRNPCEAHLCKNCEH